MNTNQYQQLLFNIEVDLLIVEHLDVYHVRHWTPEQFFARKSGNIINEIPDGQADPVIFIVLLARGIDLKMVNEVNIANGERIVVSFRKAIGDRIGYAFVSIQKRRIPLFGGRSYNTIIVDDLNEERT